MWKFPILLFTGGIYDLKIFVDLALLSVERDEHARRVRQLHSAAIGYNSVIFRDINGEVEMIDTWREVWQNLEKDAFLPERLVTIHILLKRVLQKYVRQLFRLFSYAAMNFQLTYKDVSFHQMINKFRYTVAL